jgi:hypothetical protein
MKIKYSDNCGDSPHGSDSEQISRVMNELHISTGHNIKTLEGDVTDTATDFNNTISPISSQNKRTQPQQYDMKLQTFIPKSGSRSTHSISSDIENLEHSKCKEPISAFITSINDTNLSQIRALQHEIAELRAAREADSLVFAMKDREINELRAELHELRGYLENNTLVAPFKAEMDVLRIQPGAYVITMKTFLKK